MIHVTHEVASQLLESHCGVFTCGRNLDLSLPREKLKSSLRELKHVNRQNQRTKHNQKPRRKLNKADKHATGTVKKAMMAN